MSTEYAEPIVAVPSSSGAPTEVVAAVDLGGTKTAACLVDRNGSCGRPVSRPTPAAEGPTAVLDVVARLVAELAADADGALLGVGVGAAGVIDHRTGTVVSATRAIAGWAGTRVAEELGRRFTLPGTPVVAEGRIHTPAHARQALDAGAHTVVVGTAITHPTTITGWFAAALGNP